MNWRLSRSASLRSSAFASSTIAWSSTASPSTATAKDQARLTPRAALRGAGLLLLFAVLAPIHIVTKWVFRRSRWPQRFLAAAAWIIGARVRSVGPPPRAATLLVPAHTTWCD